MEILVLNCGSSSIKYDLLDAGRWVRLCHGVLEGIGQPTGRLLHHDRLPDGRVEESIGAGASADHAGGLRRVLAALAASSASGDPSALRAIGHRVVHGGERFREPALLDDAAVAALRGLQHLAPLHNPAAVQGIEHARKLYPHVPQVAVFDTAFHATLPPHAWRYAVPEELRSRLGVRRYGFHGTSHASAARGAAALLGRPLEALRLVTLHLGNGASAAAVARGRSVDTSMGMTPVAGLVMGTRCGDLDPSVVLHLLRAGASLDEVERLLNQESGLAGLCGASDMREVLRLAAAGDPDAGLALDVYCYRVRSYVGAYHAVLGGLDALVFTAGVGENSAEVRARCCAGLEHLGVALDPERNRGPGGYPRRVEGDGATVAILVVPADEEREIAEQALRCVERGAP